MDLSAPPPDLADALAAAYERTLRGFDLPALRAFGSARAPLAEAAAWPSPLVQADVAGAPGWMLLPHPAKGQIMPGPPLQALGTASAPHKPPGLAAPPAYAGSQVWCCPAPALPHLLQMAHREFTPLAAAIAKALERKAKDFEKTAKREGPRGEAAKDLAQVQSVLTALRAPRGTAPDAADALGLGLRVADPALARYAFWSLLAKMVQSVPRRDVDLVLVVSPQARRPATAKWVSLRELQAALADASGAAWEPIVASRVVRYRDATATRMGTHWPCIADRALLLAEARGLPTLYAEGSVEASAVDYFMNVSQVGLAGQDDPAFRQAWRSAAAREAIPNLQWAAAEVVSGRVDAEALSRVDGADEPGTAEGIMEFWRANQPRLQKLLEVAAGRGDLTVVFADCTELHGAHPVPTKGP